MEYFRVSLKSTKRKIMARSYQIDINDIIGYPITKGYVRNKLTPMKGKHVDVRINSYGGDVQTALDIRQQFVDHGDVTAYVFGMTASAATILAMGAKKVVMSRYALMLVHQCSGYILEWGSYNSDQLAELIKKIEHEQTDLQTIDGVIANIYAERSGKSVEEVAKVMSEARWLNADECLALGLIDEIDEDASEGAAPALTDELREHFVACGLPIPALFPNSASAAPRAQPEEKSMLAYLKNLFASVKLNSSDHMEKKHLTLALICAALSLQHLEASEDGEVKVTAEQLQKIEDLLASLTAEKQTHEARVKELEAEVKALKAEDGAGASHVETSVEDAVMPGVEAAGFFNKFADII